MSTMLEPYHEEAAHPIQQESSIAATPGLARAEIDALIATARAFPRSVKRALSDAQTMATLNADVAAKCLYALPRDGKTIEGPSVRLAEILAASWGNLRVTGRICEEDDRFVVAQGQCIDLERNNGRQIEVRRRITDRRGRRYNDDMIVTTANAAISIATRNAILAVIPRALWDVVYQSARKAASGSMETIEEKRSKWLAHWKDQGVKDSEVYAALGVQGRADITLEQIASMVGWRNAIEDDATTIEAIFRPAQPAIDDGKAERLAQAIKGARRPKAETQAPPADAPKLDDSDVWPVGKE